MAILRASLPAILAAILFAILVAMTTAELDTVGVLAGLFGDMLRTRYKDIVHLDREARELRKQVDDANQPAQKLFDAIVTHRNQMAALELRMGRLAVAPDEAGPSLGRTTVFDKQVPLGAQLVQLKAQCILLQDKFRVTRKAAAYGALDGPKMPYGAPAPLAPGFLDRCEAFIVEARAHSLPRLALQAALLVPHTFRTITSFPIRRTPSR